MPDKPWCLSQHERLSSHEKGAHPRLLPTLANVQALPQKSAFSPSPFVLLIPPIIYLVAVVKNKRTNHRSVRGRRRRARECPGGRGQPRSLPPPLLLGRNDLEVRPANAVLVLRRCRRVALPLLRYLAPPAATGRAAAGTAASAPSGAAGLSAGRGGVVAALGGRGRVDDTLVGELAAAEKLLGEVARVDGLANGVDGLGDEIQLGWAGQEA